MTIPDTRPADLTLPCEHPFIGCPCRQPGDATGLPSATTYAVGQGILERMTERDDEPGSPELYFHSHDGQTQWSECIGKSGRRYIWLASAGRVFDYAPDPT